MGSIIKIENLSKKYIIGRKLSQKKSFREAITSSIMTGFSHVKKKGKSSTTNSYTNIFWALKDINLTIERGERLGVIGPNGAGKSTLLKVLSRITEPTTGKISIQGRIASLLEVGTGFSGELTGRENIFLNGSILGMSKSEIKAKFDDIVSFSGVSEFLDTPVKRYSSGMYVRLAFSVAAFLDPEVLIVDEVLAVGDAEFQEKCLGRMQDLSNQNDRTIIFVSHNMAAIKSLCTKAVLLEHGRIIKYASTSVVIDEYLSKNRDKINSPIIKFPKVAKDAYFTKIYMINDNRISNYLTWESQKSIVIEIYVHSEIYNTFIGVEVCNSNDESIFYMNDVETELFPKRSQGNYSLSFSFLPKVLPDGNYYLNIEMINRQLGELQSYYHCYSFNVDDSKSIFSQRAHKYPSAVMINFSCEYKRIIN